MRIRQFEFLIALRQYGSLSKAAERLFVPQPSISRAIKELEDELGIPIIRRNRTGITFTTQGEAVVKKAQIILREMEFMKILKDNEWHEYTGSLHTASLSVLCSYILMDALAGVHRAAPLVEISSTRLPLQELLDGIVHQRIDLGVIHISSLDAETVSLELQRRDLLFHPLFSDDGCFLMSATHPLLRGAKPTLAQAATFPLVLMQSDEAMIDSAIVELFRQYNSNCRVFCLSDPEYTVFLQHSDAITPCSIRAAQQIIRSTEGATAWQTCSDFLWHSDIGWVQRANDTESDICQQLLIRELNRSATACQTGNFVQRPEP